MRILSLIASSTEIVHALGFGSNMVGRSHECDYPLEVLELPYCTSPRFNIEGSSREIDERVKSILQSALSVYKVDEIKLAELVPDIIITQSQCEVCAVSLKDVEKALKMLSGKQPRVVSLEPNSLSDIWHDIKKIAKALSASDRGQELIQNLQSRIVDLGKLIKEEPEQTIACVEWIDPLMSAGNWVPELVKLAGAKNLFGEAGKHSPWMSFKELRDSDPDVILVIPCGYDIQKTRQEMSVLSTIPNWKSLKAVQKGRVYLADGNQYFNRPGPRIIESLEILIEILYDKKYDFGHFKSGWEIFKQNTYS